METNIVTCSECHLNSVRISLGNNRFHDEKKRFWRGRKCPDCSIKYGIEYRRKTKPNYKPLEVIKCKNCPNTFKQRTKTHTYCNVCIVQHNKEYVYKYYGFTGKRNSLISKEYKCLVCNKSVFSKYIKKYCSRNCFKLKPKKLPKDKEIITVSCKECNINFIASNRNQIYCNKKCLLKSSRKKHRNKLKVYKKIKELQKKKRVPKWCNKREIERIYKERPKGMEVDHIIPLNGENVSGLHVEYNLQYLSPEENNLKSNNFDLTYDNKNWKTKK